MPVVRVKTKRTGRLAPVVRVKSYMIQDVKHRLAFLLLIGALAVARQGLADSVTYAFTVLDLPGQPTGINNAGDIVGYSCNPTCHGFLKNAAGITTIDMPPGLSSFEPVNTLVNGINDAGQIIGALDNGGNTPHGFELSGGKFVVLDPPGSFVFSPAGINNKGEMTGFLADATGGHAFLYTNGAFLPIDFPSAFFGIAPTDLNDNDQIIGNTGLYDGFLYTNGAFELVHIPGARNTYPHGINNAGTIVADSNGLGGVLDASGSFTPLRVPGVSHVEPFDINDAGQIVGEFVYPDAHRQAFLATPVPEPGSPLLIAFGVFGLSILFCTKRKRCPYHGNGPRLSLLIPSQRIVGRVS